MTETSGWNSVRFSELNSKPGKHGQNSSPVSADERMDTSGHSWQVHTHEHPSDSRHSYNHAHDVDCGHPHEHLHASDHPGEIVVTRHETAWILSVEKEYEGTAAEKKDAIADAIREIRDYVLDHNGIIGHIKAYLEEIDSGISFSTTGGNLTVKDYTASSVKLYLTAIVFSIDAAALKKAMETALRNHLRNDSE